MRKLQLCENILEIYNAIDPGRTNQRTNVVFELNCAKIIDARHKLNRNLITRTVAEVCELFDFAKCRKMCLAFSIQFPITIYLYIFS